MSLRTGQSQIAGIARADLKHLICPVTNKPMQPAFVEAMEVLARRPAVY